MKRLVNSMNPSTQSRSRLRLC